MRKQNTDNFNLLRSEIKKVEKFANKITGYNDCKLTGYSVTFITEYDLDFAEVKCEICRNYEERIDADILLTCTMFDRRKSYVRGTRY